MKVEILETKEIVEVDDNMKVYVRKREMEVNFPTAQAYDKIKIKEAEKDEIVRTFIYSEGDKIPEFYRII